VTSSPVNAIKNFGFISKDFNVDNFIPYNSNDFRGASIVGQQENYSICRNNEHTGNKFYSKLYPFREDTKKKPLKKAFDGFTLGNELQTCFLLTSVFHLHPDIQKRKRKSGIALVIDHYIHT